MTRTSVDKQLERLLVLVPWVMAHDQGPTVEEVCDRFDISETELAANLELLFMCGLYPFTPDTLIEADIVDGRVWIRSADSFTRPPFFRPEEALALIAAASAALALPGNEENAALKSALAKLSGVLGIGDDEAVAVSLSTTQPELLDTLRIAIERRNPIELDYYSHGRDTWTHRRLHPLHVFNRSGQWYLQAVSADDIRSFRLDRMRDVTTIAETFEPPAHIPPASTYEPRPGDPELVLDLDPQARWVSEQYPILETEPIANGGLRVKIAVSERLWAERLLLRLGNHARVVSGEIDPYVSARRILRRYSDVTRSET